MKNFIPKPVKVALSHNGKTQHVTFRHTAKPGIIKPGAADNEVVNAVNKAHMQIMPFERELMAWIGASEKNAQLFASDPFKALETSGVKIPDSVISNLKSASQMLVKSFKK